VLSLSAAFVVFLGAFIASQLKHRRQAGNVALAGGLAALIMAFVRGPEVGWITVDALSMLGFFVLGLAAFLLTRTREEIEPLLHLELFKDTTFRASMILSFLIVTAMFGSMLLLPLFLQQVHGYDALHTGLFLLPQAATAAIAMPLGGFLSDRIGPRPVVIFGLVLLTIGSLMLTDLSATTSAGYLIFTLAIRGLAMGFAMMPSMAAGLARIDRRYTSRASGITNTLQRIATAVGVAVLVTFLSAQFTVASSQATCNPSAQAVSLAQAAHEATGATQLCSSVGTQVEEISTGAIQPPATPPKPNALSTFAASFGSNTLSIAFDRTFFFVALISALGLIPALFLKRPERKVDAGIEAMAA
jgi:predicted MFS family arabinose efflux permease